MGGPDPDRDVHVPLPRRFCRAGPYREGRTPMICARCDKPILPGQPSETFPVDSGSVAVADVTVHAELCTMPVHQTAPDLTGSQLYAQQLRTAAARMSRYAPPTR